MENTRTFTEAEAIAALERSAGILGPTARLLRCSRSELESFIARHPDVAATVERMEDETLDLAVHGLMQAIFDTKLPDNQLRAITLLLRTLGKSRGFTLGVEVRPDDRTKLEAATKLDLSAFSFAELAVLKKAQMLANGAAR